MDAVCCIRTHTGLLRILVQPPTHTYSTRAALAILTSSELFSASGSTGPSRPVAHFHRATRHPHGIHTRRHATGRIKVIRRHHPSCACQRRDSVCWAQAPVGFFQSDNKTPKLGAQDTDRPERRHRRQPCGSSCCAYICSAEQIALIDDCPSHEYRDLFVALGPCNSPASHNLDGYLA